MVKKDQLKGIGFIPYFLLTRIAILASCILSKLSYIACVGILLLGLLVYNRIIFLVGLYVLIIKYIAIDLNEYMHLDRFRGSIHMNFMINRYKLKKVLGKDFENRKVVLNFIVDKFIDGMLEIPKKTNKAMFLKKRSFFVATTNKSIVDELIRRGIQVEHIKTKESKIKENMVMYRFVDLFNPKVIRHLSMKRSSYLVKIPKDFLIKNANYRTGQQINY